MDTKWRGNLVISCRVPSLTVLTKTIQRKCFMPMNLFAQDAKENNKNLDKLVLSDEELEALRPCWPDAAMNDLGRLKALFDKTKDLPGSSTAAELESESESESEFEGSSDEEAYSEEAARRRRGRRRTWGRARRRTRRRRWRRRWRRRRRRRTRWRRWTRIWASR